MALLRLSAANAHGVATMAIAALAACGQAGAQASTPASGLTAPAGWQALPDVARAAADAAKGAGVTVAAEAWGEPARGCYAVWMSLAGEGATVDQVLAGLAGEKLVAPAGSAGSDMSLPLAIEIARPPYTGRVRARIEANTVTALACFANEREKPACETACTKLLGGLP